MPSNVVAVRAAAPEPVAVGDLDALAVGPVQEEVLGLRRQVLPRRIEIDVVALGDCLDQLVVVVGCARRPRRDRALADRQRRIGDYEFRVDLHLRTEPGAARARPVRRVEAEDPRLELDQARPVDRAGELLRVGLDLIPPAPGEAESVDGGGWVGSIDELDLDEPVRQRHRGLDRVGQTLSQLALHHEPVDDDRDVVLVLLVERDLLIEPAELAVDLGSA